MTAFARTQQQVAASQFFWEIRSVNHRYLDVSFRLPEAFRFLEPEFRSLIRKKISRGKLECQLKEQYNSAENQSMLINRGMINALVNLGTQLSSEYQLGNDLSLSHILSWPGVISTAPVDIEGVQPELIALFDGALDQLVKVRASEGAALKTHIESRLESLDKQVNRAHKLADNMVKSSRDKLLTRLHQLTAELPEGRIEQEIALIIARQDVNEELDRLKIHCSEVARALNGQDCAGRRLDFLMQELNREANTLSSKSDCVELTQSAIEMKVLIEQMREQIQNIE